MFKYFTIVLIFLSHQVIASDAGHLDPSSTSSKLTVQVFSKDKAKVDVGETKITDIIKAIRSSFSNSSYGYCPFVFDADYNESEERLTTSFTLRLKLDEINSGKTIEDVLNTPGVVHELDVTVPFDSAAIPQAYKFKVHEWVLKNKSELYHLNSKNYVIEKLIDTGSYGWVFLANEAGTEEKRAIKLLSTPSDREADMYEKLQGADRKGHPNFPKYYGVGKKWGYEWLIMEYIEGKTLGQYLKSGKKLIDQLDQQIRLGKRHMNNCGVHTERENDQENILITNDGKRAVLIDFGTLAQK